MNADESAMLRTLWANFQRYGFRVATTPPLNRYEENQCQHITLDASKLPSGWFLAEVQSNVGLAYQIIERVETSAGVWADGNQSGTAYYGQPATPLTTVVPAGTVVIARVSPTVADTFEFLLVDNGLLTSPVSTEASTTMSSDDYKATPKLGFYTRDFVEKKGDTDADAKTLAIKFKSDPFTLATNVCPSKTKQTLTFTTNESGAVVDVLLDGVSILVSGADFVTELNVTVETKTITLPNGTTITDPVCTINPSDCCPDATITVYCCGEGAEPLVLPKVIYLNFVNKTGDCASLPNSIPLAWFGTLCGADIFSSAGWSADYAFDAPFDGAATLGVIVYIDGSKVRVNSIGYGLATSLTNCTMTPSDGTCVITAASGWTVVSIPDFGVPDTDVEKDYTCPDFPFARTDCDIADTVGSYEIFCSGVSIGTFDLVISGTMCPGGGNDLAPVFATVLL